MIALSHVYFDESGTHADARTMSMAGYWFSVEQARKFSRDWAKDLQKLGISAAHMTDCALGFGEYAELTLNQRVESEKLLISHIKRRSKFGISVCLNQPTYERIFAHVSGAPSAYTFLLLTCVNKIAAHIKQTNYAGKVAYFFEAGHANSSEANKFMNFLAKNFSEEEDAYRYAAHSFVDKRISLPLQAADMLAWQTRHFFDRALDGHNRPRKDFDALVRPCDLMSFVEERHLLALRQLYKNSNEIFGEHLNDSRKPIPGLELADGLLRAFGLSRHHAAEVSALLARSKP
ncbi:MAG: DUF3800 domain-containing protein [Sphingomonadaceae bacterium]